MENREKAGMQDLATELKCISGNLRALACIVMDGANGGDQITPQGIEDWLYCAYTHLDRIADDMLNR